MESVQSKNRCNWTLTAKVLGWIWITIILIVICIIYRYETIFTAGDMFVIGKGDGDTTK